MEIAASTSSPFLVRVFLRLFSPFRILGGGNYIERAENRFQMKVPSYAIEGIFVALRRRLHRPPKVSS